MNFARSSPVDDKRYEISFENLIHSTPPLIMITLCKSCVVISRSKIQIFRIRVQAAGKLFYTFTLKRNSFLSSSILFCANYIPD